MNPNMSDRKKRIIIIVSLLVLVATSAAIWVAVQQASKNSAIRDRDTGELYDPESTPQNTGGGGSVVSQVALFGIESAAKNLSSNGTVPGYIDAIKASMWQFSRDRLQDKYPTMTLRPQALKQAGNEINGEIRLGQTDEIIPIKIRPTSTNQQAIIDINNGTSSHGGRFVYMSGVNNPNNLLFTIQQINDSTEYIKVTSYGGYNEAALEYLESIGYRIPDLNISFGVESGL